VSDAWECKARKQGTTGGNDPADCDWPVCGCDPYADKVIAALEEAFDLSWTHAEQKRLSGCLIAINEADPAVPSSVLMGIAYDSALNCITPDIARYQIERRTALLTAAKADLGSLTP